MRVANETRRRKATEGLKPPFGGGGGGVDGSVAATIFAVTDSLPGKSVGEAVQTITENEIKSEVEVSVCSRSFHLSCCPRALVHFPLANSWRHKRVPAQDAGGNSIPAASAAAAANEQGADDADCAKGPPIVILFRSDPCPRPNTADAPVCRCAI